jgi:hypothetical protein
MGKRKRWIEGKRGSGWRSGARGLYCSKEGDRKEEREAGNTVQLRGGNWKEKEGTSQRQKVKSYGSKKRKVGILNSDLGSRQIKSIVHDINGNSLMK